MRPVREIPNEFFDLKNDLGEPLPLIERFAAFLEGQRPLDGFRLLLVQHQLSNQAAMVGLLIHLGADPKDIYWLDIPYTSNKQVRDFTIADNDLDPGN